MKRTMVVMAGCALVGGTAAAQPETQEDYDTQAQSQPTDPREAQPETGAETESGARSIYGAETAKSASEMRAAELVGRAVILEDGGLVGTIQEVGYSDAHQARVATVDVSGFVGVGEKVIAIPLTQLRTGGQDSVTTPVTREWIEDREAFDGSDLRPEQ